jgi:hypothetical protein
VPEKAHGLQPIKRVEPAGLHIPVTTQGATASSRQHCQTYWLAMMQNNAIELRITK